MTTINTMHDMDVLKEIALEEKLYNRGIRLTATYLDMYEGERIRVAERDDNSAEFNATMYNARKEGILTHPEYLRLVDTDMIVKGLKAGDSQPIYGAIEATYSISTRDINKVCLSANLIRRLFPDSEVHPMLYYMAQNAPLELEATKRDVTLMRTRTLA